MGNVISHRLATRRIVSTLYRLKHKVSYMPEIGCKYDLLVDGKARVEVKTGNLVRKPAKRVKSGYINPGWYFNIHRHNVLVKDACDFYILYLAPMEGFTYGLALVIPETKVGEKTLYVSMRTLVLKYAKYANAYHLLDKFIRRNGGNRG